MNKSINKPKQYIQGWAEFYKLKFKVTEDVLIPRPETELLVDEVLKFAKDKTLTVLDLGTGCGNIAISIIKNLSRHPCWVINPRLGGKLKIIASDISARALKVARQNAKFHGVYNKIEFIQSNLLGKFDFTQIERSLSKGKVDPDIIVTNLPYIPSERIPYLDTSVKDFEPLVALDGGEDGFDLYRKLFNQISTKLKWKPKLIIGEIDYTQGDLAINEAQKYFPDAQVEVKFDLTLKQRILVIQQAVPLR